MRIVYEDSQILVVHKDAGEPVQSRNVGIPDLESKLRNYLSTSTGKSDLWVIHRLDQPVAGLLVFGKTKEAAGKLSAQLSDPRMQKEYLAYTEGDITKAAGADASASQADDGWYLLTDHMYKDAASNSAVIVSEGNVSLNPPSGKSDTRKGNNRSEKDVKEARLYYRPVSYDADTNVSCIRVRLITGRFHQIRAQISHLGYPIVGDSKYGAKTVWHNKKGEIALSCVHLSFVHPQTGKTVEYTIE